MRNGWLAVLMLVGLVCSFFEAHASRVGRIDVEGVEVFEAPGRGSTVLEVLPRGSRVAASNFPTEGFYKIRTGSGIVGFVSVDSIVVDEMDSVDPTARPPMNTQSTVDPANPWRGNPSPAAQSDNRNRRHISFIRLRGFGSWTLMTAADINAHLSLAEGLKNAYGIGGEVNFRFTRDLSMVIRAETISNAVVVHEKQVDKSLELLASAFPIMAGLEVTLSDERGFSSYFGVMAGIAVNTMFQSTVLGTSPEPRETQFVSQNFTGLGRLLFAYHVNKTAHLYAEIGYRFLRTEANEPTQFGSFSEIWNKPITLDMSGVNLGAGLALHF